MPDSKTSTYDTELSENNQRKIDWRWFAIVLVLVASLVSAIIINNISTKIGTENLYKMLDIDNGDQKINWSRYTVNNVELKESYKITNPGIYHFTGEIADGLIEINVNKNEPVKIILDNVKITNSKGPAISCYDVDDLVVELNGNNYLEDASEYGPEYDSDVRSTFYSKSDTTFQGNGTLTVVGNKEEAIVSKDDLKFVSGTYNLKSADDAVRGTDSVYIINGEFNITSTADAIKSTNDTDVGKGFVLIENGEITIDAGAKGIKALKNIIIYGGTHSIKTYDDAIHSDNYISIAGGDINIYAGDDGIHANKELIVDNGKINIEKAYEGLEAQVVSINGGEISLYTTDDGINAGGGADSSAINRKGAGMFDADLDCTITINGGYVYVNASGDGIDSNGYLVFNGGKIVVDGPTNNGNGALDSGVGITMNGGEVIAIGASGMAVSLGQESNVYNISVFFDSIQQPNTEIEIKKSDGSTVLSHTSAKSFSHLSAGSNKFQLGETYDIYVNGEKYQEFTISNITTTMGNNFQNMPQVR